MSRQSKNARNRVMAKQVTSMHLSGQRAGKDTERDNRENKGKSQARRAVFAATPKTH